MTGLLLVSHSRRLAEGLAELVREMAPEVPIIACGGEEGALGVSADAVVDAYRRLAGRAGAVVALADLGSALMNLENARDLLGDELRGCPLEIADAPFVEGAIAASMVALSGGEGQEVLGAAQEAWGQRKRA